jgi:hypothetical protein
MQIIPLQIAPAQSLVITLNGQNCRLNVYQRSTGMFVDLFKDGVLLLSAMIGRAWTRMIRDTYLGFAGDLMFSDWFGTDDPQYTGFGVQWDLIYLEPSDLQ